MFAEPPVLVPDCPCRLAKATHLQQRLTHRRAADPGPSLLLTAWTAHPHPHPRLPPPICSNRGTSLPPTCTASCVTLRGDSNWAGQTQVAISRTLSPPRRRAAFTATACCALQGAPGCSCAHLLTTARFFAACHVSSHLGLCSACTVNPAAAATLRGSTVYPRRPLYPRLPNDTRLDYIKLPDFRSTPHASRATPTPSRAGHHAAFSTVSVCNLLRAFGWWSRWQNMWWRVPAGVGA